MNTPLATAATLVLALTAGAAEPLKDAFGDPLPEGAVARVGTVRLRHAGAVAALAFSPDDKVLASGGYDKVVRLWDAGTGKLLHECRGPTNWTTGVAFSPDGKRLASADMSGKVFLWDPATGRELAHFDDGPGAAQLTAVAFTDGGKGLVTVATDGSVHTRAVKGGGAPQRFGTQFQPPFRPAFSADGALVVTAGRNGAVTVWDTATGKPQLQLTGQRFGLVGAAFSPDGRHLATGGGSNPVALWELATGQRIRTWDERGQQAFAFAPDGRALVSAGWDKVHVWDMETGKERRPLRAGGRADVLAFSHDGKALAVGTQEGVIRLFDFTTGKERGPTAGATANIAPLGFTDGGKRLAVATPVALTFWAVVAPARDGAAWTVRAARRVETGARPLALSPDGKLAVVGQPYQGLSLWDVQEETELHDIGVRDARGFAFARDGKTLLMVALGQPVAWDVQTGKVARQFERLRVREFGAALAPDGKTLAVAGGDRDNLLRLYDFATGKEQAGVPIPTSRAEGGDYRTVIYSPGGGTLLVADDLGGARLFDVAAGRFVSTLAGGRVWAFAPDGKRLAGAGHDGVIRLWDVASSKSGAELRGHGGAVTSLLFSPDGRLLVSGSADHTVLLWDVGKK